MLICRGDGRAPESQQSARSPAASASTTPSIRRTCATSSSSAPGRRGWRRPSTARRKGSTSLVLEIERARRTGRVELEDRELPRLSDRHFRPGARGPRLHAGAEIRRANHDRERRDAARPATGSRTPSRFDDGARVPARAVIIATGAEYRRPAARNLSQFEGAGVYYGATFVEAQLCGGEEVIVVGGGNSAGQAAVFLAQTARRVHMLVRSGGLAESMSRYLIRRIEESPTIVLHTHTEIVGARGRRPSRARPLAGQRRPDEVETHDDQPCVRHDRRRAEHALARRLRRARCQGFHQDRSRSLARRSGRGAVAARTAAAPARDEPARRLCGRRRARRKHQARRVGGRRGLDCGVLRASSPA